MAKKKKKCVKGDSCGYSCIQKGKICRKKFSEEVGNILESRSTNSSPDMNPLGLPKTKDLIDSSFYDPNNEEAQAILKILEENGVKEPQGTAAAIKRWSEGEYEEMRELDKAGTPNEDVKNFYEGYLDNPRIPTYDGQIYRGLTFKGDRAALGEIFVSLSEGDSIELDALSSFSSDNKRAKRFAKGEGSVIISVRKNKSGKSIQDLSTFRREAEVVVPKGAKYRVVSNYISNSGVFQGVRVVEVEEL